MTQIGRYTPAPAQEVTYGKPVAEALGEEIERRKAVKEIKAAAAKAEKVLLATDPDREGEAIAWHVAEILKANKKTTDIPCLRITFDEIT